MAWSKCREGRKGGSRAKCVPSTRFKEGNWVASSAALLIANRGKSTWENPGTGRQAINSLAASRSLRQCWEKVHKREVGVRQQRRPGPQRQSYWDEGSCRRSSQESAGEGGRAVG